MDVIRDFDPWRDPLCTCPPKYGFNPYTGCSHKCLYCYITSYIPRAFDCRPKENLLQRVRRDIRRMDKLRVISMSNSSDPYPPIEAKLGLTRSCLETFAEEGCRVLVVTKSDLVKRDVDVLSEMAAAVSVTVVTLDEELCRKLEPGAPPAERRLEAMRELSEAGIPVSLRLDPLIPGLNDDHVEEIVEAASSCGVSHIVSSTFKPRPDSWRRVVGAFPELRSELAPLYFEKGMRHQNSWYLPLKLRRDLMEKVRKVCDENSITFASCREGFPELSTGRSCDGSHLIP